MTEFFWRIAMEGDHASLATANKYGRGNARGIATGNIAPFRRDGAVDETFSYIDHALLVAKATESAGFTGGLLPSFPSTEDPWAYASALLAGTDTYRFMVAYQPGFLHPLEVARASATYQQLSGGRLVFNVITGGGGPAQLWWGDRVAHDDRYARTKEFLDIIKGVWSGDPFSYDGRFFTTRDAALPAQLQGAAFPELYFSGSSDAAIDAAGAHADFYLSWLEPRAALAEKFEKVRERSALRGRTPKFALRIEVLARPTPELAWAAVERAWQHPLGGRADAKGDSVGASRQAGIVPTSGDWRDLQIEPNVWAGFNTLRAGPALGLVGSYEQVAERLSELVDLGVDSFILASTPHLEEAYRVGENVLPLVG
ncbi:LLM class flavin-dependent oxidoreductase [Microbacterium protaetiae]|uniref:LLM class flavin-dependent oxidoreductase n=1 Tax=Microbacterium protaetiae TaxID=2509458 RepID=A0A4P6EB47_9MICO|nr:LLM class flavin-dependent oxidoreductase [Microbacterium protaetiae]QAY59372.1 LLM class flavin-dependent oxidoreductase [Microbacterium protaetiae]